MGREFSLLGDPVLHSLSPTIHRAAFGFWGVDASYAATRVTRLQLPAALRQAAGRGGGNVTLPHKGAVAGLLDVATIDVSLTGACNCFWGTGDGRIAGDNTDVGGFIRAIEDFGIDVVDGDVLVLGAGGAARAVVLALHRLDARKIEIWNRTPARADKVAAAAGGRVEVLQHLPREGDYDLVVNATSRGLEKGDPLPLDLRGGVAGAAFDLVYAPGGTEWVRHAGELGIPAQDGLGMLVHQAALSLERWFPDREPPLQQMRAAAAFSG
jgi:shikimate dehydrogenase